MPELSELKPTRPRCATCSTPMADYIKGTDGISRCPNTVAGEPHGYFEGRVVNDEVLIEKSGAVVGYATVGARSIGVARSGRIDSPVIPLTLTATVRRRPANSAYQVVEVFCNEVAIASFTPQFSFDEARDDAEAFLQSEVGMWLSMKLGEPTGDAP